MTWSRLLRFLPAILLVSSAWAEDAATVDTPPRAVIPYLFPKSVARCNALNRKTGEEKTIQIQYVDINPDAERTLVMVHGWPSLWHSWKYQIEEFKTDYRVIAVDLRGFGESTHPGDVQSSGTMADMVGDLACALNQVGIGRTACVGHDWGTQVCYEAARMRPDLFEVVVGICIPYLPYGGPFVPIEDLVPTLPKLAYNVYFERSTDKAVVELNRDIRRTLRGTLRSVASPPPDAFLQHNDSFLQGWGDIEIPPIPFLTPEEEDYWVQQYELQGFDHTLNFYTYGNKYGSWEYANAQGNLTIPLPALSILPTADPVANWVLAAELLKTAEFVPHLTTETVAAAAHWVQMEKPDEVNGIMRRWLTQWYPPAASEKREQEAATSDQPEHTRDEL